MTSRISYNNPDAIGGLDLAYHYEILADRTRVAPLRRAIERVARGRRVLESGAGSGVLSILAAKMGAERVYAVEKDPAVAWWVRRNVEAAGYGGVIRVIEKDSRCLSLDDVDGLEVDLIIAEHLSTWQVMEPQISVMNHLNTLLAGTTAQRIPECAFNHVELARSQFKFEDVAELRTYHFLFSGIARPAILSAPTLFKKVDFRKQNDCSIDRAVDLVAISDGIVNSLCLTSPLRLLEGITFQSSDSLMPPVVVPLASDLEVRAGDHVTVRIRYRCESSWTAFHCGAQLADGAPRGGRAAASATLPQGKGQWRE